MAAITIQDLNNAKTDVDHIADFADSLALTATDRLGHTKRTLAGIDAEAESRMDAHDADALARMNTHDADALGRMAAHDTDALARMNAHDADALGRMNVIDAAALSQRTNIQSAADLVLAAAGYAVPVAYTAGLSMTVQTQTVSYNGETYAPIQSQLPFTTSGTFETAKFRLIQGVSGADLGASTGASLVGWTQSGTGAVARTARDKMRERVSVKDFGAVGDGVTDDTAAFKKAIAAATHLYVPSGVYIINECLNIKSTITIEGETGTQAANSYPSVLQFANGITGLFLHRYNTNADTTGHTPFIELPTTTGADGSIIKHLWLRQGSVAAVTPDGISHGVHMKCRAMISDCFISGFSGNGVNIFAVAGSGIGISEGNANNFDLDRLRIVYCNHGIYVDGPDANAGNVNHVDCTLNTGWGIWDSSFLGNTYVAPHAADNGLGPYFTDDVNASNLFLNPYSESGQPGSELTSPTRVISGLMAAGYTSGSYGWKQGNAFIGGDGNGTKIARCDITAAGSGYTNATVTIAAPATVQATATAVLSGGRVVKATITNAGGGYSAAPAVTVVGNGTGATAVAHLSVVGTVTGITITSLGSGYTTATFTIGAPGAGTTATAVPFLSGGTISRILVTNPGKGYTAAPVVTITGDGTGATATASRSLTIGLVKTNFNVADEFGLTFGDTMFSVGTTAPDSGSTRAYRWSMNRNSLDFAINYADALGVFAWTGAYTAFTFGRSSPIPNVPYAQSGLWLGSSPRMVTVAVTVPPVSGQFAQGDVIFKLTPAAASSPGVVCTTGGTAGTTAVFKAMSNLAA